MKYRAVIFDLFETLITEWGHTKYTKNEMCSDLGIDRESFDRYWSETAADRCLGKISFTDSLLYVMEKCGKHIEDSALSRIVDKRVETKSQCFAYVNPDVYRLLEELKARGLRLAIVSNCSSEEVQVIRQSKIYGYFDQVILSYEVNMKKPNPDIYQKCCDLLGVDAGECIFVGDGCSDELEGAQAVGMKAIQAKWYTNRFPHKRGSKDGFLIAEEPLDILRHMEYQTYAQRSIRHCIDMLAPFEMPDQQEKGHLQFYQFMVSLYRGMYERPEEYLVFPKPYEEYMAKWQEQEAREKREKAHVSNSRESTLRNTFQQAIQFYALYLYRIGVKSEGIDGPTGALMIRREDYADVIEQMNRIHESQYNAGRYDRLSKLGIQVDKNGDTVHIVHREYPQMMEGVAYLCKAPDSKYKWMNFLRLDFQNAYTPAPTVHDICKTLPHGSSEAIRKLEHLLSGMRIKAKIKPLRGIVSDFKWKVEYAYKGKSICGFYADREYFMLCIYFNHFQNINAFAKSLYEEDYDLFQWFKGQFPERLCKCPNNRRVYFGDEPRRICGLSNRAEIVNPDGQDVDRALYVLRKYRNIGL